MKTIIANIKMNQTPSESKDYLMTIASKNDERNELIVCLPFTSLSVGEFLLKGKNNLKLGAQNICDEEKGAFTGEISGAMLRDAGADYVIVGHSERRSKFRENGRSINKKIKIALKNRLGIILCVGESLTEKNTSKTNEVLKNQIEEALKGLYENELENIIIAYEPIWAIGSGKTPLAKEIDQVAKYIKKVISEDFSNKAVTRIAYGGSVNLKNANSFLKCKNIDGLLIGSACLDPNNLLQILSSIGE